jgi:hypothetical protein
MCIPQFESITLVFRRKDTVWFDCSSTIDGQLSPYSLLTPRTEYRFVIWSLNADRREPNLEFLTIPRDKSHLLRGSEDQRTLKKQPNGECRDGHVK